MQPSYVNSISRYPVRRSLTISILLRGPVVESTPFQGSFYFISRYNEVDRFAWSFAALG